MENLPFNSGRWLLQPIDLLAVPLALVVIGLLTRSLYQRYAGSELQRYLVPSLLVKLIGGMLVGVIYAQVYGGGDSFYYYSLGRQSLELLWADPLYFLGYLGYSDADVSLVFGELARRAGLPQTYLFGGSEEIWVGKIAAIAELPGLRSYLATGFYMSYVSWLAVWGLFRVFVHYFPRAVRESAIAVLFIPSVFFWGSGILKDTVTLTCLCFLVYGLYRIFIVPKQVLWWVVICLLSAYLLYSIRDFILFGFLPFASIWLFPSVVARIPDPTIRRLIGPVLVLLLALAGAVAFVRLASDSRYGVDSVFKTAYVATSDLQRDAYYRNTPGSRYELPSFDGTINGAVASLPLALATTYIRPFLWEINSAVVALSAIESFLAILILLRTLTLVPLNRLLSLTMTNRMLLFMLLFSLFYGWMSALGSGNFGNLVRYKIPALPFFFGYTLILYRYGFGLKSLTVESANQEGADHTDGGASNPAIPPDDGPTPTLVEMRERLARRRQAGAEGGSTPRAV